MSTWPADLAPGHPRAGADRAEASETPHYEVLAGGTANSGRIIRIGDAVHRPRGEHTSAVHALFAHLQTRGFDGAPKALSGRPGVEVVTYLSGTAATEPLPRWALTEEALHSVSALVRGYHDHAYGFDGGALRWQRHVPADWRGRIVTHNDINPANVIFRGGRAVGLIDFDLAAPGTPAWDLAIAACFWIPLRAETDVTDERIGHTRERLRTLLDGYQAGPAFRRQLSRAFGPANRWITDIIQEAADGGHPAFGELWSRTRSMHSRAADWIAANQSRLEADVG
jgi:hypothetical protein